MKVTQCFLLLSWIASLFASDEQIDLHDDDDDDDYRKIYKYDVNIPDYLEHDCKTIKPYSQETIKAEPWWIEKKSVPNKPIYAKYNHAYGILVLGASYFTDESMRRACYLVRYIFAEHEHVRRMAYQRRFYVVGNKGGWCCPPQMGNKGLSCPCGKGGFPFTGRGAPAHEMAHSIIRRFLSKLTDAGLFQVPPFVEITDSGWKWAKPTSTGGVVKGCANIEKESSKYGSFYDFVWNSYQQDKARGKSKIKKCKYHHYFIYSGQQYWLFIGNEKERTAKRAWFKEKSPNLYNLMASLWQCSNDYIPVCKDKSQNFELGLAQTFKIGKSEDKSQPWKMTCRDDLDKAEISNPSPIDIPTEDGSNIDKCRKVARQYDEDLASKLGTSALGKNQFKEWLETDTEYAWNLRQCCYKSANFSED